MNYRRHLFHRIALSVNECVGGRTGGEVESRTGLKSSRAALGGLLVPHYNVFLDLAKHRKSRKRHATQPNGRWEERVGSRGIATSVWSTGPVAWNTKVAYGI